MMKGNYLWHSQTKFSVHKCPDTSCQDWVHISSASLWAPRTRLSGPGVRLLRLNSPAFLPRDFTYSQSKSRDGQCHFLAFQLICGLPCGRVKYLPPQKSTTQSIVLNTKFREMPYRGYRPLESDLQLVSFSRFRTHLPGCTNADHKFVENTVP